MEEFFIGLRGFISEWPILAFLMVAFFRPFRVSVEINKGDS